MGVITTGLDKATKITANNNLRHGGETENRVSVQSDDIRCELPTGPLNISSFADAGWRVLNAGKRVSFFDSDTMTGANSTNISTSNNMLTYADAGAVTYGEDWTAHSSNPLALSGASVTFSSIPTSATEMDLFIFDSSATTTSDKFIRLGDSGGIETSGYASSDHLNLGTYFGCVKNGDQAGQNQWASFHFIKMDANRWMQVWNRGAYPHFASRPHYKSLSANITQLLIDAGSGNWDNGNAYLFYRS